MIYFVDCWLIMLDLSVDDVILKYIACNLPKYVRSLIYDVYHLMSMYLWYEELAVHVWLIMIWKLYLVIFSWFMLEMKLYVDLSLKLMISTYNMMSIWLIMLMKCLVSC